MQQLSENEGISDARGQLAAALDRRTPPAARKIEHGRYVRGE